jgi:hypothetical protein
LIQNSIITNTPLDPRKPCGKRRGSKNLRRPQYPSYRPP